LLEGFKSYHLDRIVVPVAKTSLIYMQVGIKKIQAADAQALVSPLKRRNSSLKDENSKSEMVCLPELDHVQGILMDIKQQII
jgi:hypothetical protein